jgi:hypothetical protein
VAIDAGIGHPPAELPRAGAHHVKILGAVDLVGQGDGDLIQVEPGGFEHSASLGQF